MLGGLGPEELGAGVLATTVFFKIMTLMHGVMSRLTVLLAHAHGAGRDAEIPKLYGSALVLALLLSVPLFIAMSHLEAILLAAGTEPGLAGDAGSSAAMLRRGARHVSRPEPYAGISACCGRCTSPAFGLTPGYAGKRHT